MQARVFRTGKGVFTLVLTPRKRYGLVPVVSKGLTKEGCSQATLELGGKEDELKAAVRAAKQAILRP